jgi:hypothetical protein
MKRYLPLVFLTRTLTRDEAIEQYMISLIAINELLCFMTAAGHFQSNECPEARGRLQKAELVSAMRSATTTWLWKLFDTRPDSLNIFRVWKSLFHSPYQKEIDALEAESKPIVEVLRKVRHKSGAHSDISLEAHFLADREFEAKKIDVMRFCLDLLSLATKIHLKREVLLPEFESEVTKQARRLGIDAGVFMERLDFLRRSPISQNR